MKENVDPEAKPKKKGFLSFLMVEEKPEATTVATPATVATQPAVAPQPTVMVSPIGAVNADIYQAIRKAALEENNLPGPDYAELKTAANAMAKAIPDESTRFAAAYATLQATNPGLTKMIVLNSIDSYLTVVEKELNTGLAELEEVIKLEVTSRQEHMKALTADIEAAKTKILELQDGILKTSQEINTINGEMLTKQAELDGKKSNFIASVKAVANELTTDKNKLQTLIPE